MDKDQLKQITIIAIICSTVCFCSYLAYNHLKEARDCFRGLERVEYTYRNTDGNTVKRIDYKKTNQIDEAF